MNPRARSVDNELVNAALVAHLCRVRCGAAAARRWLGRGLRLPGAEQPSGGRGEPAFECSRGPVRPARALGAPRPLGRRVLGRRASSSSAPHWSASPGSAWAGRCPRAASDCSRSPPDSGHGNRTGHRRRRFREGPPTPGEHPPPLAPRTHRAADVGYLLGPQPWSRDLGIGRGLDPRHRPAALRQGPAPRHQRDPRRTRRRRDDLDAP